MPVSQTFLDPLSYLRDSMLALKDRVREAVSAELSRIVGQTVQDVMQRALQRTEPPREPPRHDPWDDEIPDDEDEDDEVDNRRVIQPSPPRVCGTAGSWPRANCCFGVSRVRYARGGPCCYSPVPASPPTRNNRSCGRCSPP